MSARFWLNMQQLYELMRAEAEIGAVVAKLATLERESANR
jgi:plasmid maintenance system antidote protein VapI